ncbi:MAG TPA: hypothetical protein VFU49_03900 [Ktedonobacteraceae bacterium]|nr:hypothetical protein [Ktedonobacteraceae bacterium]
MKKIIQVGTTVWRNTHGNAILEVTDFSPNDPAHQSDPTISGFKQRFGGPLVKMKHPAGNKSFDLDLNFWSNLPDDTHLSLRWIFVPEHSHYRAES